MRTSIFFLILLSFSALVCAQSTGTVQGTLTDPTGAIIPGAQVVINSAISGYSQTTQTDANGFYRFTNVPYQVFTVHAEAQGFSHKDARGELRSNVPLTINFKLDVQTEKQEVTVTEDAPVLETTSASTHHDLDYVQLQKAPVIGAGRGVEAIVQTVPGVVQDDNGRMHPRGSESQVQYVVDGVPITENLSASFSSSLDARGLRSAEVITGNVPAEYGSKLGAVVTVNTKSGLEMPWSGSLGLGGASFGSGDASGEFGGHTKNVGIYLNASGSMSDRYLDPSEIANFHNHGGTARLFTKVDWNVDANDALHLNLSTNGSNVDVPNRVDQQSIGQDQKLGLRDDSESLSWSHILSPSAIADVVAYRRSNTARLEDPNLTAFPVYAAQTRRQRNEGFRANLSYSPNLQHFKFGIQFNRTPLRESFAIASTDPAVLADLSNPLSAYSLTSPFVFDQRATGKEFAAYVQDRITWKGFTLDAGLRFDHYDIVTQEDAWSPRVGFAYHINKTGTVLRGSYNRLFQTPPTENLLLSSSAAGAVFSAIGSSAGVRTVPPEKTNYYEFGVQQQVGKFLRLDIARYVKNVRNFSDKDQFLDTPIIFPVAIARGDIRGLELRLDLIPFHGFTAYVSYANSRATATTPIVGGLFLGEVNSDLLVPGNQFPADHDERNTGAFGVTYTHKAAWINFSGRHDSGVPADIDPAILPTVPPIVAQNLDAVRGRVKPRTIFDVATGIDLMKDTVVPITFQFSVSNLTDAFYLYNFESVFSGTHVGRPREFAGRIVFHIKGKSKPGASSAGD
jgi:outer membrane cobalamin receptor